MLFVHTDGTVVIKYMPVLITYRPSKPEARKVKAKQNKVHLSKPIFSISCVIGFLQTYPRPWWLLGFYDSTRDKDDTTVGVGHSRRYCNTGYDQSQGRRPSTLKCIGPISKRDIEPNHPSEINPNSDSRSRSDGRSRRLVQYRVDQSQGQRPRSLLYLLPPLSLRSLLIFM